MKVVLALSAIAAATAQIYSGVPVNDRFAGSPYGRFGGVGLNRFAGVRGGVVSRGPAPVVVSGQAPVVTSAPVLRTTSTPVVHSTSAEARAAFLKWQQKQLAVQEKDADLFSEIIDDDDEFDRLLGLVAKNAALEKAELGVTAHKESGSDNAHTLTSLETKVKKQELDALAAQIKWDNDGDNEDDEDLLDKLKWMSNDHKYRLPSVLKHLIAVEGGDAETIKEKEQRKKDESLYSYAQLLKITEGDDLSSNQEDLIEFAEDKIDFNDLLDDTEGREDAMSALEQAIAAHSSAATRDTVYKLEVAKHELALAEIDYISSLSAFVDIMDDDDDFWDNQDLREALVESELAKLEAEMATVVYTEEFGHAPNAHSSFGARIAKPLLG